MTPSNPNDTNPNPGPVIPKTVPVGTSFVYGNQTSGQFSGHTIAANQVNGHTTATTRAGSSGYTPVNVMYDGEGEYMVIGYDAGGTTRTEVIINALNRDDAIDVFKARHSSRTFNKFFLIKAYNAG